METHLPPLDGTLPTVTDIVDFHATHNADKPWFMFLSKDTPDALVELTFRDMADASHRIAHRLRPNRAEGTEGEVVAILIHTDTVLYNAVLLGIMRAGLVPYPMSPRNSPQGVCHMLETVKCKRIMAHAPTSELVQQVTQEMQAKGVKLRIDELPDLPEVFPKLGGDAKTGVAPYPPRATPVDMSAPALYIHSSGSTGYPKSVPFSYRRLFQWIRGDFFGKFGSIRYGAMGLPSFHAMGCMLQLVHPLARGAGVVVYTPQWPAPPVVAHAQNVYEVSKAAKCNAIIALPSYVEAWSHNPEIVEYLKTLSVVIFGGGPLAQSTGDKLVQQGVRLMSGYGGTEFGNPGMVWDDIPTPSTGPDPDWAYMRVPPNAPNVKWDPLGDGTYELIVQETENYEIAVHNVPGQKAYATSDLFEPHPTKPGLWKIVGRKDDVITLSNGEKIVPIPQESYITASPLVLGCVMFGREREQPGILVEPQPAHAIDPNDERALAAFRNKIWPRIEEANALAPAFAKIFKEMILVTDPDKPLPRAAKGTIIRKQALAFYKDEIEQLYETIAKSTNNQGIPPPDSWTAMALQPWLSEQATSLVSHGKSIAPEVDLFQQGFDSLSATFFRNRIIGAMRTSDSMRVRQAVQRVSANLIFEHPTIVQLAGALEATVDPSAGEQAGTRNPVDAVRAMIAKYTANLPTARAGKGVARGTAPVVLLTGSTGNIGSHILAYLLAESRVGRIYTLNRPSGDPRQREKAAFHERGLPEDALDDPRLVSLAGEVTRERFGLDQAQYEEILASVTHVIHNAWTVNFNLALQSFEDQIAGVRKLVEIAAAADRPVRLLVTSSIGIANGWGAARGPVPEHLLPDPEVAAGQGYAASKYVVEHILSAAREKGVHATAVRMGQACGPKATGAWGTTEWMPILTKTSVALGCLPGLSGPVNWIPLDAVGEAYVDWVLAVEELPALVNVVHPRPTTWDVILRGLREELGGGIPVVPPEEWVAKLEERAKNPSADDLVQIPALKLMDFFRALGRPASASGGAEAAHPEGPLGLDFETAALLRSSPSMREFQPMTEDHARAWVRFWKAKGFVVV